MISAAFASKVGIITGHVALQSMRLQPCLRQNAMYTRFAHAHVSCQPAGSTWAGTANRPSSSRRSRSRSPQLHHRATNAYVYRRLYGDSG
jgi:hypothetical protein